jgi:hypothetical protein
MIYQITAANLGDLLAWAFVVVLAAVIFGVFFVDIIYAVFSRAFSSVSFSLEPTERDVNQRILAGAARLRAERKAREAVEVSE